MCVSFCLHVLLRHGFMFFFLLLYFCFVVCFPCDLCMYCFIYLLLYVIMFGKNVFMVYFIYNIIITLTLYIYIYIQYI